MKTRWVNMILCRLYNLALWTHHDLDLGVEISRSESEIALSQDWDGRLTWNEKDVSHAFMTMILTSLTMVRWADVPDSDWGDFRRRRAVDIFSWIMDNCCELLMLSYTDIRNWMMDIHYWITSIEVHTWIMDIDNRSALWILNYEKP